ncbi:MAG: tyrosine-type recombinase/integrase [Clostridia bacterium]|nr:tyrosine-type recombinase/integrase [Clostridia bacterium]
MKKWLKIIKSSVEETTYCGYEKLINGRITTYFENKKVILQTIKAQDIQDFYQYLIDNGLSGNTVKHYHSNIRKALQYAVKTDVIISNPADKVELPKIDPYNAKHYTSEEVLKLLKIIENTKLETSVILSCFYGLRRSEVVGLKWSAIDFTNKTILINHTVTQISFNHSNKLVKKDKTKTKSSTRTLPLLPVVENYLLELKEKQEQNKIICGNSYNQEYLDYICVDNMGTLLNPDYVSHAFIKLLKKNDLRIIRFHDLRYTCASLLLAEGINMKQIQVWLGHSNYNTTANIYAHLDSNSMNESANAISNVLSTDKIKNVLATA